MVSDKEMLERISKLSSAIEQRKRGGGYAGRGRGTSYYQQPYRPTTHRTLNTSSITTSPTPYSQHRTLNNNKSINNLAPSQQRTLTNSNGSSVLGQHRTLNNTVSSQHRTLKNTSPGTVVSQHRTLNNVAPSPTIKNLSLKPLISSKPLGTTTSHNRTLVINHKGNHQIIKSTENGKKKVSIDGVEFVVKGKKLIRQDLLDKSAPVQSTAPKVLIRRSIKRHKNPNLTTSNKISKLSAAGKYKKGNLVYYPQSKGYVRTGRSGKSLVLKPNKTKHCGFFTRYGQCPKADVGRCLFRHDRSRRAICMRFLRNQCKKTAEQCRLSHSLNPHILPHCAHFQKGNCNNVNCPYAHVGLNPDAPVCKAFAMEGYCPKGLACHQKHVHLCPEFAETSKCSNINCRLPHVARKTNDTKTTGIVRLGSWVSPKYFYEQKVAKEERRKAAAASKVWSRPSLEEKNQEEEESKKPIDREQEEEQGFVRLFDDSDDDEGWSQFEREDTEDNVQSLRFNDDDDEDDEDEVEDNEEGDEEEIDDGKEDDNEEMKEQEEEEMDKDDVEQSNQSDDDEEGQFYDAEQDVKDVIVLSDDDSDMEEVYEEISDDAISDEDLA